MEAVADAGLDAPGQGGRVQARARPLRKWRASRAGARVGTAAAAAGGSAAHRTGEDVAAICLRHHVAAAQDLRAREHAHAHVGGRRRSACIAAQRQWHQQWPWPAAGCCGCTKRPAWLIALKPANLTAVEENVTLGAVDGVGTHGLLVRRPSEYDLAPLSGSNGASCLAGVAADAGGPRKGEVGTYEYDCAVLVICHCQARIKCELRPQGCLWWCVGDETVIICAVDVFGGTSTSRLTGEHSELTCAPNVYTAPTLLETEPRPPLIVTGALNVIVE